MIAGFLLTFIFFLLLFGMVADAILGGEVSQ